MLVATSTLAMGVNTPASTVILVELQQWDGTPYSVAQYKNMIGRAGRLGFTERGRSAVITPDGRSEHAAWHHYVLGSPEDLRRVSWRPIRARSFCGRSRPQARQQPTAE